MNITPKFQQGGSFDGFYNVFTPLVDKSESTTSSTTSSSSSKKSKKDDDDDTKGKLTEKDLYTMIKDNLDGLPNEMAAIVSKMQRVFQRAKLSGLDDLNDISTMYLSQLHLLKQAEFNKDRFKDARTQAIANGSLNDMLITSTGRMMALNNESQKIEYLTPTEWQEVKNTGGYTPITGGNALWFRANHPDFVNNSDIFTTIENSIGIDKVVQEVQKLVQGLGKDESNNEMFYTKQGQQIAQGAEILQGLLGQGPDGVYRIKELEENQKRQVEAALNYVFDSLPQNAQNRLKFASNSKNIEEGVNNFLLNIIGARTSSKTTYTTSFDTSASKVAGTSGSDELNEEKTKYGQWYQIVKGEGGMDRRFTLMDGDPLNDQNYSLSINGKFYSALPGVDKGPMSLADFLQSTGAQNIIQSVDGITFGGAKVDSRDFNNIMYDNTGGIVVTLPKRVDNGIDVVNLDLLGEYNDIIRELKNRGISESNPNFNEELGKLLHERNMDELLDENGLPSKAHFGNFLVLQGYSTEKVDSINRYYKEHKNNNKTLDTISLIDDKSDPQLRAQIMEVLGEKSIDKPWYIGDHDIYQAGIYIPLNNNLLDAINADGVKITPGRSHSLEGAYQYSQKLDNLNSTETPNDLIYG